MNIALVWHCKTLRGWRRFPVLTTEEFGRTVVRYGWVVDRGEEVCCPDGRFQLRSFIDGKQHFETLGTRHPAHVIREWEIAKKRAAPAKGRPANTGLLKNAADAYVKSLHASQKHVAAEHGRLVLAEFQKVCTTPYVRSVTAQHVDAYHAALRKGGLTVSKCKGRRGLSERTIANKQDRLRSFFRFLKLDTKWMPEKPKYEQKKPDTYSPRELTAIREAAEPYMRLVIDMALQLGLRERELMFAEWSDVSFEEGKFKVQAKAEYGFMTKDKEQRVLAAPAVLLQRLTTHRATLPEGTRLILGTASGKPNTHLLRSLKRLAHRAGLNCGHCQSCRPRRLPVGKHPEDTIKVGEECEKWPLHKFSRTCLTMMLRNGEFDVKSVQEFAGHSSLSATLRYLASADHKETQVKVNALWKD